MQGWDVTKILPNHGAPAVIRNGGYDKTLIEATRDYVTKMLSRAHDAGLFDRRRWKTISASRWRKGWIFPFESYREVHDQNLKLVHDYWKDKTLPKIAP